MTLVKGSRGSAYLEEAAGSTFADDDVGVVEVRSRSRSRRGLVVAVGGLRLGLELGLGLGPGAFEVAQAGRLTD